MVCPTSILKLKVNCHSHLWVPDHSIFGSCEAIPIAAILMISVSVVSKICSRIYIYIYSGWPQSDYVNFNHMIDFLSQFGFAFGEWNTVARCYKSYFFQSHTTSPASHPWQAWPGGVQPTPLQCWPRALHAILGWSKKGCVPCVWRVHHHFLYEHFKNFTIFFEQVLSGGPNPSGTIIVRKWVAMATQLRYVGVGSMI